MTDAAQDEMTIGVTGAAAVITLDRPKTLNALTSRMRRRISDAIPVFARDPNIYAVILQSTSPKAFCAGSDVREILGLADRGIDDALAEFAEEYRMNWLLECFSKPTISLINGMVMGGGVGLTGYNTHRIAGENYSWAMPETIIGLFPDVGVAHALSRLGPTGQYLALTGRSIRRADAFRLGLASHCIDSVHFPQIAAELALANTVDPLVDGLHRDPGAGELGPYAELIDRAFRAASVEDILEQLERETGAQRDWAQGVITDLRKRAPLSLKVTHRHVREAASMDIKTALEADYRLARAFLADHDFREGVRAALIDKDGAPAWRPARLEDVSAVSLAPYFTALSRPLDLPTREDMQRARV